MWCTFARPVDATIGKFVALRSGQQLSTLVNACRHATSRNVTQRHATSHVTLLVRASVSNRNTTGRTPDVENSDPSVLDERRSVYSLANQYRESVLGAARVFSESRLIRLPELLHLTGLTRSTQYRLESSGKFPKRIKLGERAVAWLELDVRQWIGERRGASPASDRTA